MRVFITVCTLIVLAVGAHAEPRTPEFSGAKEFEQSLHFKRGHIVLPGGLAAKTGLLAKLLAMLATAKKFLVAIVIGIVALVKRLFGRSTA